MVCGRWADPAGFPRDGERGASWVDSGERRVALIWGIGFPFFGRAGGDPVDESLGPFNIGPWLRDG